MTGVELLAQSAMRGTVVLAMAFLAAAGLRRSSAAVRHFVWTAAFAALLALPAVTLAVPKWGLRAAPPAPAVVAVAQHVGQDSRAGGGGQAGRPAPQISWGLVLWIAGCAAAASRFVLGAARTSWMVRRAAEAPYAATLLEDLRRALGIRRTVRTLESAAAPMPLAWGILRPVTVLPEEAREWPPAHLRSVLLHELVHVQRLDLLAQAIAQAACCLFWFHPLAWVAARQLRKERERACDDAVLERGVAAPDYAGHLMDLVRALAEKRTRWASAPAMAEASDLESRVRALLERGRNRRPLNRRAALAVAAVAVAVLLPAAAITAHAQAARGSLAGVVQDPSGARVPNCGVTAKSLDGPNQEVATTNAAGEYRFVAIPAGRYTLEFSARGFKVAKVEAAAPAGNVARVDANLAIGSISEAVTVVGQKARPAAAPAVAGQAERIKVGGNVQPAKLIRRPRPVYPEELQQLGVEGSVVIRTIISKDGQPLNPEAINLDVHPGLVTAALDAVRQWRYQPTLLNGQPVEVVTTVTIEFQLAK